MVDSFICDVCFVFVYFSSLHFLVLVPWEGNASWLWLYIGIFKYTVDSRYLDLAYLE